MTDTINGTPGAANPVLDKLDRDRRARQLIRQITNRQPVFRGVLAAQRRDLGELADLTGVDPVDLFVCMDGLDRNIADLCYWARRRQADDKTQRAAHNASLSAKQTDPP